jgi:hypothetical protein
VLGQAPRYSPLALDDRRNNDRPRQPEDGGGNERADLDAASADSWPMRVGKFFDHVDEEARRRSRHENEDRLGQLGISGTSDALQRSDLCHTFLSHLR